ncbi:hypothetical protein SynPROS71_02675 [Synechococcus sp. PROS-7-1]|nr:hypothetical protein SynPROS71_02675 [Synechococcus sp. PROS-7-1]
MDAVVGAVIAVTATTAMLSAVQVTQSAFDQAGRSPLIEGEVEILRGAGYDANAGSEDRQVLEADLRQLPVQ